MFACDYNFASVAFEKRAYRSFDSPEHSRFSLGAAVSSCSNIKAIRRGPD